MPFAPAFSHLPSKPADEMPTHLEAENQSPHDTAPLNVPVAVQKTREEEVLSPSSPAASSPDSPWSAGAKSMATYGFGAYGLGGLLRMPASPPPRRS